MHLCHILHKCQGSEAGRSRYCSAAAIKLIKVSQHVQILLQTAYRLTGSACLRRTLKFLLLMSNLSCLIDVGCHRVTPDSTLLWISLQSHVLTNYHLMTPVTKLCLGSAIESIGIISTKFVGNNDTLVTDN